MNVKRAAYFFCTGDEIDPVARHIYQLVTASPAVTPAGFAFQDKEVMRAEDAAGNELFFVQSEKVLSHDYARVLAPLNEHFGELEFAGIVNWHEGQKAPDKIFCIHSTIDAPAAVFGKTDPRAMRALLKSVEAARLAHNLADYKVWAEGSHWSGTHFGSEPALLAQYHVPVFDIEIGSSTQSWQDPKAQAALAESLFSVFDYWEEDLCSLLCVGGMHFEPAYTQAFFEYGDFKIGLSHIIPNQWYATDTFDGPKGVEHLLNCAASIQGGVHGIVFHDGIKGPYKATARAVAEKLGVPVMKHRALRKLETLPLFAEKKFAA